jgi:hypothetical protein
MKVSKEEMDAKTLLAEVSQQGLSQVPNPAPSVKDEDLVIGEADFDTRGVSTVLEVLLLRGRK